ncbi:MAG: hypothetical protein A3J85_02165 [Desulfobacula sp. RIFOXYA12_FULL_46_16]|nr:MAG: hypothetical protein A2464_08755 [Deltaproteobacteria bacterium RIFOXYC2_FULL_48_10]OGR20496.1 MAG: hypothetical protein A3J85_02165 [Desulfobacula sp. RIFOXYA12_FULL_46_16]OGR38717.1 MAG: hypothetical protein A3J80_06815 [Desulfobacula sp. RIFOXYB2_FULL_45_6]
MDAMTTRQILSNSKEFKLFWKNQGPFRFALTSSEFPPVLLEPEEWIFSNHMEVLLKSLIQYDNRKMQIVPSPFNPGNKTIFRPEELIPWKISNFPEEWNASVCDCFIPEGHLTRYIFEGLTLSEEKPTPEFVERAFFHCLANCMEQLGYLLFKPRGNSKYADIKKYLTEWEEDDMDAGLL